MTCREKLRIDRPDKVGSEFIGGCDDCPHDYGYLPKDEDLCWSNEMSAEERCGACWDREIPGTSSEPIKTIPIDYTHIYSFIDKCMEKCMEKKDRYVSAYFATDGSVTVSVYPNDTEEPNEQS